MFKDLRYQFFRAFVSLLPWGTMRTKYIVKHKVFRKTGKNFYFCPRKLPADPKLIAFHDNVSVAADVVFCNHDVMQKVFNQIPESSGGYNKFYGCIEVMDNVFIGTKAVILPNVRIEENVIVAAGSIVTSDLKSGGIYGGNPARKIGEFDELLKKRMDYAAETKDFDDESLRDYLWNTFYEEK